MTSAQFKENAGLHEAQEAGQQLQSYIISRRALKRNLRGTAQRLEAQASVHPIFPLVKHGPSLLVDHYFINNDL